MGRGGKRLGAGRKPKPQLLRPVDKGMAARVLALPESATPRDSEEKAWHDLLWKANDQRLRFDARKYLTDKRDGKPVQALQHVTENPVQINVNIRRVGA